MNQVHYGKSYLQIVEVYPKGGKAHTEYKHFKKYIQVMVLSVTFSSRSFQFIRTLPKLTYSEQDFIPNGHGITMAPSAAFFNYKYVVNALMNIKMNSHNKCSRISERIILSSVYKEMAISALWLRENRRF